MPTPTYDLISSSTLGASAEQLQLSGLTSLSYRDLIVVIDYTNTTTTQGYVFLRVNDDANTNYADLEIENNSTQGRNVGSLTHMPISWNIANSSNTTRSVVIYQINDFKQTDKLKTILWRHGQGSNVNIVGVGRWSNTDAISSLTWTHNSTPVFASGTIISVYGIAS